MLGTANLEYQVLVALKWIFLPIQKLEKLLVLEALLNEQNEGLVLSLVEVDGYFLTPQIKRDFALFFIQVEIGVGIGKADLVRGAGFHGLLPLGCRMSADGIVRAPVVLLHPFAVPAGHILGMVGDYKICAGSDNAGEQLKYYSSLVNPTISGGRFDHRVLS